MIPRPGLDFAHRGLHGAGRPENGLAAIRAAHAAGHGAEIDLRLSADGVAMVFHDDRLDRMTGQGGAMDDMDAAALGRLRLDGTGETIPTLAAVLAATTGPLLIEFKDRSGALCGTDGRLERATAAALDGHAGPVAVMSFNPDMVAELGRLMPARPRGLTTCAFGPDWGLSPAHAARLRGIADYGRVGACFVSHDRSDLDRPRLADLRAQGAVVLAWTVRSPAEHRAARRHCDAVTFEGYVPCAS
ncbi:phosphodiesterase [Palleronia sediminis]|uniref:Phosphodiesterase n=1 Tax=Palleronia sediminis TaxID=2547833 RepID=A0A4R6A9J5_9RHOB|nr:glycerophosphodiester phosphodiesterase family protein [Palleronia sediminis]TDL79364.1 phosphodiesterase [Palleronia sediminis]